MVADTLITNRAMIQLAARTAYVVKPRGRIAGAVGEVPDNLTCNHNHVRGAVGSLTNAFE
jgi:hypothetical protein